MREFVRGQRAKIEALTPISVLLVGVSVGSKEGIVFDISCFGVDGNGVLSDDRYLVFYNQRRSSEGEIEVLGPRDGDVERTMASISEGHVRLMAGGAEVARYPFAGADFGEERFPESRFVVGVCVQVACLLESKVAGLTVEPGSLPPGERAVTLRMRDGTADALLSGNIKVRLPSRYPRHRRHRRHGKRYGLRTGVQRPALGMT
jgi:hypothetical protein